MLNATHTTLRWYTRLAWGIVWAAIVVTYGYCSPVTWGAEVTEFQLTGVLRKVITLPPMAAEYEMGPAVSIITKDPSLDLLLKRMHDRRVRITITVLP